MDLYKYSVKAGSSRQEIQVFRAVVCMKCGYIPMHMYAYTQKMRLIGSPAGPPAAANSAHISENFSIPLVFCGEVWYNVLMLML